MTPYRSGLPIDTLPKVEMSEEDRSKLQKTYRSYLGMINWLATTTRPDLTTVHSLFATSTEKPTQAHIDAAKYVGRYIKATADYGISFSSKGNSTLECFLEFPIDTTSEFKPFTLTDSGWGPQDASVPTPYTTCDVDLNETRSICSHMLLIMGGPLVWKSHKEKRTSRSSCEAEVKTTDEGVKSSQWIRNVLSDLGLLPPNTPTPIYNDNQAAVLWCNTTSQKGMRHYNIRENAIREAVHEYGEVAILHITGKTNPADIFTKEHKSSDVFRAVRDSFMSRRSSGGCWHPSSSDALVDEVEASMGGFDISRARRARTSDSVGM
jgi:hypothetical protein